MKVLLLLLPLLIFSCVSAESSTDKIEKKKLIADWVSRDDAAYRITFTPSLKIEYYDKDITSTSTYKFEGDVLITEDKDTKEIFKYSIISLTDSTLSMIYLDRGNTLNFKKINTPKK